MKRLVVLALLFTSVAAQAPQRRTANIAALLAHPGFYHQHAVIVVGKLERRNSGELRLVDDAGSVKVVFRGSEPDELAEVRGEFWDLGRMSQDDPRLANYDPRTTFQIDPNTNWPKPGEVGVIMAGAVAPAPPPMAPSIRNLVLYPGRFVNQKVTVTGQFGGRNLLGDLPEAPARSRYDFVVRSSDAAIWVVNLRPRGKDFELALDARIDTGRWVEISGVVQQGRGLTILDATAGAIRLTKPPAETTADSPIRVPSAPPPEVVFSAPIDGETDVSSRTNVRVQFSRDINPATFKGRIAVRYGPAPGSVNETASPPLEFTTQYMPGTRVLEIRFVQPLESFRPVQIDLVDGILGSDQQTLRPWTLKFEEDNGAWERANLRCVRRLSPWVLALRRGSGRARVKE